MKTLKNIVVLFSILACMNYGGIALFETNFIATLFKDFPTLLKITYFLFGCTVFQLILFLKKEK